MRRKQTYQELANATLAKTQLGAVTLPYVPYNDNALAVKELRVAIAKTNEGSDPACTPVWGSNFGRAD